MTMATDFLNREMGQMVNRNSKTKAPSNLSDAENKLYRKRFAIIDKDSKGYVSITDIRRAMRVSFKKFFFTEFNLKT